MTRFSRWDTTARLGYLTAAVITARLGYLTAAVITARLGYLTAAVITVSAILTAIMTLRAPRRAADDETRKQPWELSTGAFQAR